MCCIRSGVEEKGNSLQQAGIPSLGLLCVLKLMARDEFWKQMVRKFLRSLLEAYIVRVRIGESWGISLKMASSH